VSKRSTIARRTGDETLAHAGFEIVANTAVLQTERADTGRSIDAVTIEELPLGVNRNFQSLLDLVPGTFR
jgi:hypothetical protein